MTIATSSKLRFEWPHIIFMGTVHIGAMFALLPSNFSWTAVGLTIFLHWITGGLGITLGLHRLVTHRSFQTPKWLEYLLVFFGSLACEGGVIEWVGLHRYHHLCTEQELDLHSSARGFWWSHMIWILYEVPAKSHMDRYIKDIADDPFYQFLEKNYLPIQITLAIGLYLIGGWSFVVWGVFLRLVLVLHCTWFVNSAAHKFGYHTYETGDRSTNCWWAAILTYGEGWHNNHHAFQYSARHGLQWWEIDLTWMTIMFLKMGYQPKAGQLYQERPGKEKPPCRV